jgi:hypothetical protein
MHDMAGRAAGNGKCGYALVFLLRAINVFAA